MAVSAHDVARELRRRLPWAGVVKIHKLLYYCQGWHLAWADEPMFDEPVEAWANGPVIADLWRAEKYQPDATPAPAELDPSQLATLNYVISRYGHLTGKQLITLTHEETPWRTISMDDDPWATIEPRITDDMLRDYFTKEDEEEVTLRALSDRALGQPAIRDALEESMQRPAGVPDDLAAVEKLILSRSD